MILEVATLDVRRNCRQQFETAFAEAQAILRAATGYVAHELRHCLERPDRYILLIRWERLENHTVDFRNSPRHEDWKRLLHHFYDPIPTVQHFEEVAL